MEEKKITIENLEINYKTFALPSVALAKEGVKEGKAVLVLHGWGIGSDSWVEAAVLLAQNNFCVIVPDMPGFGKSEAPKAAWNVDDYVEWVKNFAKELKLEKFVLIGHSFGGQVATKFAMASPEKVDKLVLCAAAVVRKPRLGSRQRLAKFLARGKIIAQKIPLGIYPALRKINYKIAGVKDYSQLRGVMAQTFLNVVAESVLDEARKIKTPTLIVWGEKDKETPIEDAHETNKAIAGSRLEIIKNAGHKLHRAHPQELKNIIFQFLK